MKLKDADPQQSFTQQKQVQEVHRQARAHPAGNGRS